MNGYHIMILLLPVGNKTCQAAGKELTALGESSIFQPARFDFSPDGSHSQLLGKHHGEH